MGLAFERLDLEPGHPIVISTWAGRDPTLPSVLLNSHLDVVPVDRDKWTVDPWEAEVRVVDGERRVYGMCTIAEVLLPPTAASNAAARERV